MRPTRGWLVNIFLWLCPLTALAISLAVWWTTRTSERLNPFTYIRSGHAPLSRWFLLPVPATLLALIVAWTSRRLLGFFAATSFLLAAVLAMACAQSYSVVQGGALARWDGNGNWYDQIYREWWIVSLRGRLCFTFFEQKHPALMDSSSFFASGIHDWARAVELAGSEDDDATRNAFPPPLARLGFFLECQTTWSRRQSRTPLTLALPFWFLLLFTLPAPLAWTLRARRRRRARLHPSACPHCGYDLRATPDPTGPRLPLCPECGTVS